MSRRPLPRRPRDAPDLCPVCGQRGTVTIDQDGYVLVQHAGRVFSCRPRPETPGDWIRVQAAALVASSRAEATS